MERLKVVKRDYVKMLSPKVENDPVSYTHLDVYKRQVDKGTNTVSHRARTFSCLDSSTQLTA